MEILIASLLYAVIIACVVIFAASGLATLYWVLQSLICACGESLHTN